MDAASLIIKFHVIFLILLLVCSNSNSTLTMAANDSSSGGPTNFSTAILIRVDQSGQGDFKKIQDAIDAVPSNNSELFFIWVKPGTYREKIVVPGDKPFITLSGTEASNTIITWSDGGDITDSPTLTVLASDFVARYLTIQNSFGTSGKAVALKVKGDRVAFYGCRIQSYQDTLLDDAGRHYYSNCYIEGAVDFIFGNAASLYERCHIHSVAAGAITAQGRESPLENTGFTFLGCKITGTGGSTALGRPWGSYSRVVFVYTFMSSIIQPEGWNDWGDSSKQSTAYYGEYKCYGAGANRSKRVGWSRSLSNEEAAPFLTKNMIGGRSWLRPAPTHFKRRSTIVTPTGGN
ncbi:putative pectinesterase 11 [Nicotiana tomentosiformis]|uniref:putative pectinesterase 11 n=1 Tax=Nicotiana tomentosiformis TaxID=4098 RepID=UPI00051C104F|nr:putative pectinesterase 11 isoform X1 [Nicotiana tomentosiformis]